MFPRFIELTHHSYRIEQEISAGATAKVFLAKRRIDKNKDLLIQIASTRSDFSYSPKQKPQTLIPPRQTPVETENHKVQDTKQEKFKQQEVELGQISKGQIKNADYPQQKTAFNKTKTEQFVTGDPCAIKIMCMQGTTNNQQLQQEYLTQLQMLQKLNHPGIISLIDHGILKDQKKMELCVVLEWGVGGHFSRLIDLVHERPHYFCQREQIFRYYAAQLIDIIAYLQSKGISHRDIKAQNLILDKYYRLRLIDFGAAEIFDPQRCNFSPSLRLQHSDQQKQPQGKVYVGSKHYISPQMIQRSRQNKDLQRYSKTDIWSIGVVLYYMFTRKYPFQGSNTYFIIDNIKVKEVDYEGISDPLLVPLLRKILQKAPQLRADIHEIKAHQYFKDIDFSKIFQIQSPILGIIKSHSQQYFYTGQALVKIFGITQYRVIGIFRRSSIIKSKKPQLQSDRYIGTQEYLQAFQGNMTFRYYLSIAKKQANSIPKHLQVDKNTKLQVTKLSCLLLGVKFNIKLQQQPDAVQLRFNGEEELDKFVTGYRDIFRGE